MTLLSLNYFLKSLMPSFTELGLSADDLRAAAIPVLTTAILTMVLAIGLL